MRRLVCTCVLAFGCGNDVGRTDELAPDAAGPPGSPIVTVTSPRGGEAFYAMQAVPIAWTASDDDSASVTCDVAAVEGTNRTAIATAMTLSVGQAGSATWTPGTAAASTAYRILITCTDGNGLTGGGASGTFAVSAAPQVVDYVSEIQPIWNASCTSVACHDAMVPAGALDLTSASSYAELYDQPSGDCPSTKLVNPGDPNTSYLVHKLQGGGPCFIGTRMPKSMPALAPDKLQLVRDWIYNGALANP